MLREYHAAHYSFAGSLKVSNAVLFKDSFWIVKVDSDDSEQVRRDSKLMAGVGEVIVYVHRTRREGLERMMVRPEPKVVKEVAEKALKGQAISHSVT